MSPYLARIIIKYLAFFFLYYHLLLSADMYQSIKNLYLLAQ